MSYEEVREQYSFSTIKAIKKEQVEKYLKMGYILVSDFIIDIWGLDLEHCYMVY
jgi:hypothetical protein